MDTITHTMLGAALFSRTGLAGGLRGAVRRNGSPRLVDWTFWAALFFGAFPDVASLGIHLIPRLLLDGYGMWRDIPPYIFTLYRCTHSLVIIAVCLLFVRLLFRPLFIPMLAWPFHVITDVFTHGPGRFQTPILYPVSDFKYAGVNWWEHPEITTTAWAVTVAFWMAILGLRYWNQISWKRELEKTQRMIRS
ncbi:MAG: hypothetical protein PHP44_08485 [Kiritimatiellae bacterium]|nr:hypothetical protein [Kiritimatiellia bacterium]MDD4736129.1 hypothetical protein [Kiritimatiellia bacterium]